MRNSADKNAISVDLWSGLRVAVLLGGVQLVIMMGLYFSGALFSLLSESIGFSPEFARQASLVLMTQSIAWAIYGPVGGILVRVVVPFGYYSRMSWWGLFMALLSSLLPVVALMLDGSLLAVGLTYVMTNLVTSLVVIWDVMRLLKPVGLTSTGASWRQGLLAMLSSQVLTLKSGLEMARQNGVRIILTPLAGAADTAVFSTTRTGVNVALQGVGTISQPVLPELMIFIGKRDQARAVSAMATIWFVIVSAMAPAVLALHLFGDVLFQLWTDGKIPFEPGLFGVLSFSVIIFAFCQPATAIITGNNLLRTQLLITLASSSTILVGLFILVKTHHMLGAGIALLLGEIVSAFGYSYAAKQWFKKNDLGWPTSLEKTVLWSVGMTGVGLFFLTHMREAKFLVAILTLTGLMVSVGVFYAKLPNVARAALGRILERIPFVGHFKKASLSQSYGFLELTFCWTDPWKRVCMKVLLAETVKNLIEQKR